MNVRWLMPLFMLPILAALPASSTYQLNSYGFGTGGVGNSTSTNYAINGTAGEVAGSGGSTNYKVGAGEAYEKQSDVPLVTLSNTGATYNKLLLQLDPQNNPSDTLFSIAISTDNFATTKYVKNDFTITATQSFSNYLTYSGWGGSTGVVIRGLTPNTVYTAKATAYRGKFTESSYGPASVATTTATPQLSFHIDVAATDTGSSPPYIVDFGTLPVSTVTSATNRVWVSLDTNAESGGNVYVSGQNTGLKSLLTSYTIVSQSADLATLPEGFGVQGASSTQSSGGPLSISSPYNVTGTNIGITDPTLRQIFTAPAPITAGRGSFYLMAKSKPLTPASSDYTEILTAVAAAVF